ncbi:putative replication-associated protein [Histomonas meleagridis]|uniref:putative replication-associated protein n=1 Tax=Histomonas meleagridis TaxID=135588 RepID=UPI00355A54C2|nr:putative replication-associated protein [Histomonas meleagridis]KAH0806788.1 putative replication-associated protein [Histomonas meleagridis]
MEQQQVIANQTETTRDQARIQNLNPRAKRRVYTLNNPTEEDVELLKNPPQIIKDSLQFMIFGNERAPTTGTIHLQGYINFKNRVYKRTVVTLFVPLSRAYLEPAKGTEEANINYCKKEGDFWMTGEPIKARGANLRQGSVYIDLLNDIKNGMGWDEIEEKYPVQAMNKITAIERTMERHIQTQIGDIWNGELSEKNIWIWGPPGTGKSRWAWNQGGTVASYPKMVNKWWDGYRVIDHKYVICEDWPKQEGYALVQQLKQWSDRFPFIAKIKGKSTVINPGNYKSIITANYSIEDTFIDIDQVDKDAIKRRFKEIEVKSREDVNLLRV